MRRMNRTFRFVVIVALSSVLAGCSGTSPQARHDHFLMAGKRMLAKQDYARAALQFKNAVRLMPQDPEAQFQLGLATLGLHDLHGAIVLFQKTYQLDSKHMGAQLKLAELMSGTNDREVLEDSERRINSVLALAPGNTDALNILAVDELKLGHADSAEAHLRESLGNAPSQVQIYSSLAGLALARKDLIGAEKVLKQGIDAVSTSAEPRIFLGQFYLFTHRTAEAEAQFQKAVEISPRSGPALLDLGRIQDDSGETDAADKTFQRASSLPDKRYQPVHAIFLWQHGERDAAIREFAELAKKEPGDRTARTRLVAAYMASKNTPEAVRVLTSALKKNPRDADALVQRSQIYLQDDNVNEAETDLIQVIKLHADDARVHYFLSRVYKARNQDSRRRQELSEALRRDPSLLAIRVELADTFIMTPKIALDLLDAAPERQRHLLSAVVMRNWALLASGDFVAARKGIEEGLAQSKAPELILQDGVLKLKQHQVKSGRLALEAVLKKDPTNGRALRALANSYFSEKEEAEGIAKVREYAGQEPYSAPVQEYLGEVLLIGGDLAGARAAFLAAKNTDPSFQPADMGLALLDSKEGNFDSARQILHRLMDGTKPNSLAAVRLGMIEESTLNYAAAIAAFKKALETRTGDWVSLNDLAYCLILTGQTDEALKYAQQANEIAPDNHSVIDTLGWALYNKGIYEAALRQLEALKNDPSPAHRYHLAMAYFKCGDITQARATLDAARKMDPDSPEARMAQQIAAEATRTAQGHPN
jgi:tetratricopeptide (TPR) repeat protein